MRKNFNKYVCSFFQITKKSPNSFSKKTAMWIQGTMMNGHRSILLLVLVYIKSSHMHLFQSISNASQSLFQFLLMTTRLYCSKLWPKKIQMNITLDITPIYSLMRSQFNNCVYCFQYTGHKEVVELLLKRGAEPNARESQEWTPLHLAAMRGIKCIIISSLSIAPIRFRSSERIRFQIYSQNAFTNVEPIDGD